MVEKECSAPSIQGRWRSMYRMTSSAMARMSDSSRASGADRVAQLGVRRLRTGARQRAPARPDGRATTRNGRLPGPQYGAGRLGLRTRGSPLNFLADRPNPTRFDHFIRALTPDDLHAVVDDLESARPRFVVWDHGGVVFWRTDRPNRILSDYIWRCYKQVGAFRLYLVLERTECAP